MVYVLLLRRDISVVYVGMRNVSIDAELKWIFM